MNARHFSRIVAFWLALLGGGMLPAAHAQDAPVDSLAAAFPDSLGSAALDSLGSAPLDSLFALTVPDSAAADSVEAFVEPWLDPWRPAAAIVDGTVLDWTRPEDFERALDWMPGTSVRVAGETGMDAFVDTGPLGRPPEIFVDGLPTRSPADLDPGLWDRASNMIVALSDTSRRPAASWGGSAINASLDDPLSGRTVLATHFSRAAHETYTRAVGLRTPGTERMLRFDFQEFKTEEGYDYSLAPGVIGDPSDRGRAKQRRFRLGAKVRTDVGELGFEFGRGRRYTRGDAMSSASQERWTGRIALTFDRENSEGSVHARLYHLDFRDEWRNEGGGSWQSSDAARTGVRVERVAPDGGFFGGLTVEEEAARFLPSAADTVYVDSFTGRAGAGWRGDPQARWMPWLSAQAVAAEHTDNALDLGGRAGLRRNLGSGGVQILLERVPEIPTLTESYGTLSRRLVRPVAGGWDYDQATAVWTAIPGGEMRVEHHDRVEARMDGALGRLQWEVGYAVWRLRDGIGWKPGAGNTAVVVSGLEADVDMLDAVLAYTRDFGSVRMRALARGHWLPGDLESNAGRPGGFPRAAALARLGFDRHFFSERNRIGIDVDADFMGEHFDDLTGPIGGVVPSSTVLDTRAWLRIRTAELYFAVDNVLDEERMEVLGTWRRFRQFRFGLTWDFYN
jgi:hypothetical protein